MFEALFKFLKYIFKTVTKLSIPYFSLEENDLKFKISTDNFYNFTLYNIEIKTRHDSYVYEAYTLKANDIFLEYIHTYNDAVWNVQAFSCFLDLLKDNLKINSFENLEKKVHTHYEFNIYRVNKSYNLHIIYIYEMYKEIFIVDTKGDLYENLLRNFEKSYNYEFPKNENIILDINISLAKNNAINNYFRLASN
ncbi:hypothetical protein [Aliarcobacter vitoriensis]|uniref:Uncharacterized protein n=1 Tax=Aliarcobacter vitoriensis TaxID=2011099 RepID=A0A366MUE7_9BACT|nr:hypothetical protein [Aliarcobacter vitoriensis]RBQ29022.1 hypothetical protein CRU91_06525 [Aliarcobacter vitoriensis]